MAHPNDARVAALRSQIETKRAALKGRSSRFVPLTNCSLPLDGAHYNLHQISREEAILIACKLQALKTAGATLGFTPIDLTFGGFDIDAWLADLQSRLDAIALKAEETKLNSLDKQLQNLLSTDARTDMALNDIAGQIG